MKKIWGTIAMVLVAVCAISWGLIGLFDFNIVEMLLGKWQWLVRTIYVLIGVAGIMMLIPKK